MNNYLNLGNKTFVLKILIDLNKKKPNNYDIRITNSHITNLNNVIGRKVFKKDALYVSSETLWEIMQPLEVEGKHHHTHELSPEEIYNALSTLKDSKEISVSYDNRFVIVTLATIYDGANLVIIVAPDSPLINDANANIIKIITIYPDKKKK